MTETDPEKRLIGYACISTYGQMLDTQLSRAHLRRRRRSGIGRLTDPTAAGQPWLREGSSCPEADPLSCHDNRPGRMVSRRSPRPPLASIDCRPGPQAGSFVAALRRQP